MQQQRPQKTPTKLFLADKGVVAKKTNQTSAVLGSRHTLPDVPLQAVNKQASLKKLNLRTANVTLQPLSSTDELDEQEVYPTTTYEFRITIRPWRVLRIFVCLRSPDQKRMGQ